MKDNLVNLITIQGATATGKSKLALKLAEHFSSEIISADSRQIYKFMNIGTAKPTSKEQKMIKHHLIDIITPDKQYNAGSFVENAGKVIEQLQINQKIPIITGGTGFYISSLLSGLFNAPQIPEDIRKNIRKAADEKGTEYIYQTLKKVDTESAQRISRYDKNRLLRALEIWEATGKTISNHWEEQKNVKKYRSFNILITLKREKLYSKINQRVDKMIENGLIEEVQKLLGMGYTKEDPGMNAVGYKEFFPYFAGDISFLKCCELIKKNSRNYAKRQITWFRKQEFDLTLIGNDIIFSDIATKIKSGLKIF